MKQSKLLILSILIHLQCLGMDNSPKNILHHITTIYYQNCLEIKKKYAELPEGCIDSTDMLQLHRLKRRITKELQDTHGTTLEEQLKLLYAQIKDPEK